VSALGDRVKRIRSDTKSDEWRNYLDTSGRDLPDVGSHHAAMESEVYSFTNDKV